MLPHLYLLVLFSHCVSSEAQTLVLRHRGKHLFLVMHMVCHWFVFYSQIKVCFLLGAARLLPKCSHLECWQGPRALQWVLPCCLSCSMRILFHIMVADTGSGRLKIQNCRLACWCGRSQLSHLCSLSRLVVEPSTGLGLWGNLQTISVGSAETMHFHSKYLLEKETLLENTNWGEGGWS